MIVVMVGPYYTVASANMFLTPPRTRAAGETRSLLSATDLVRIFEVVRWRPFFGMRLSLFLASIAMAHWKFDCHLRQCP